VVYVYLWRSLLIQQGEGGAGPTREWLCLGKARHTVLPSYLPEHAGHRAFAARVSKRTCEVQDFAPAFFLAAAGAAPSSMKVISGSIRFQNWSISRSVGSSCS